MIKKILLGFLVLCVIFLLCIYLVVPSGIHMASAVKIECTAARINDCLNNTAGWYRWWPSKNGSTNARTGDFELAGTQYKLIEPFTDGARVQIIKGSQVLDSRLMLIPGAADSIEVRWEAAFTSSLNPFVRLVQYLDASKIKASMDQVLTNLSAYANRTGNIYGFEISRTTFMDTILLAKKFVTKDRPSQQEVYDAVDQIKDQIKAAGAKEMSPPMMNTRITGDSLYETMVAVSMNREIIPPGGFFISRMMPLKNRFLFTEVTGGPGSINNAHRALDLYMEDHMLSAPAIPFEVMITDRRQEKDSAKWKTEIVYPSM